MNTLLCRLGLAYWLSAVAAAVPAWAQALVNVGFEQVDANGNPLGWTESGGFATEDPNNDARTYVPPTFALSQAYQGQRVYGVVKDGSRLGGTIFQRVTGAVPGTRYRAGVRCRTYRSGNGEMRCVIGLDPAGGTNPEAAGIVRSVPISSDGEWTRITVDAIAHSTAITVYISLLQGGSSGFAINYIDSAELIPNPPMTSECTDGSRIASLSDRRVDVAEQVEANYTVPAGYVITGIGARGTDENVATMVVRQNRLLPDGELEQGELVYFGYDPGGGTEAAVMLPPCYIAVGYGARAAPEWDIHTLVVWARSLEGDGRLGPMVEFRAGVDPSGGMERQFLAEEGRVLTGVGLRMQFNDLTGIRAVTDRYATVSVIPRPSILLEPASFQRVTRQWRNPTPDLVTIANVGTAPLNFGVASTAHWVAASPDAGTTGVGEAEPVQIVYDASTLGVGEHEATLYVWDAAADNSPQTIDITLTVTANPADFDQDGDVDLEDFGHLQRCFSGPGVVQSDALCLNTRLDEDEDVDQADFGIFQLCLSGANQPADPSCAP
jgi:hypothetical protein